MFDKPKIVLPIIDVIDLMTSPKLDHIQRLKIGNHINNKHNDSFKKQQLTLD